MIYIKLAEKMFNLISTLIKTTFQATVFVTVGVAGFTCWKRIFDTYLTKPSDESIEDPPLAGLGKTISQNAPIGFQTVIKIGANNVTQIDDYVFFKTARFAGDNKPSYLGVANHWLLIKK